MSRSQGYKAGDIRGGIIISVNMNEYQLLEKFHLKYEATVHLIIMKPFWSLKMRQVLEIKR